MSPGPEPVRGCRLCPRLVAHRKATNATLPDAWGGAVPSWGPAGAGLLIVGLAPGRLGAHRTGRPFTGDASGTALFKALHQTGFSTTADPETAELRDTMITNSLRCLPPENRPTAAELAACRPFLTARIRALPHLRAVLTLGRLAHDATLRALDLRPTQAAFAHGAAYEVNGLHLHASYHCSRYNMNTRRLTPAMMLDVLTGIRNAL